MEQSLWRHFAVDRQRSGVLMSNVGKPAVILALAQLGYNEPEPKGKSRFTFHIGDIFENFIEVMLQLYGIEILDVQTTHEHMGITGHSDYTIVSPVTDNPVIVEAKTMSDGYHRMFYREQDDNRAYVSQLAMYHASSGHDCTWITYNKGTGDIGECVPNPGQFAAALERARKIIPMVREVKTLRDVLHVTGGKFIAPPPRPEIYRRQETGRYILHPSIAYSPFASALYLLTEGTNGYGKPTMYVEDYAPYEHMVKELEFLVENGVVVKY